MALPSRRLTRDMRRETSKRHETIRQETKASHNLLFFVLLSYVFARLMSHVSRLTSHVSRN
jgi:hypothetical protein